MAETGRGKVRLGEFDIDKVPQPCRFVADLGGVAIAVPILVRPCRLTRDVVAGQGVGIRREQHRQVGAGSRVEVVPHDQGDDLVTLVTPSECGTRRRHCESKKDTHEKCTLCGSPAWHHALSATGSTRLGSLFFTLPTRVLTGQLLISSAG